MSYDSYRHLLQRPYVAGRQDCYGLAMDYYKDLFGVQLLNVARPDGWWNQPDINLIDDFMNADGWEQLGTNTRALKKGDGLVFSLINGKANHVGIYVGNGAMIHHVWRRYSEETALLDKWTSRLLMIVRHPEVTKQLAANTPKLDLTSLIPEGSRERLIQSLRSER